MTPQDDAREALRVALEDLASERAKRLCAEMDRDKAFGALRALESRLLHLIRNGGNITND